MIRFQNIPKLVVAYQSIKTLCTLPFLHRRQIKTSSKNYIAQNQNNIQNHNLHICKHVFEKFDDKLCLIRWGEVSDRDFGGSSKAELYYSMAEKCLTLKGKISPDQRQKIQTIPFVGLIQKNPFSFKTGIYNSFRICLRGDGDSVGVQIRFFSPLVGQRMASATILTKKDDQWSTYQLPFRNFQIKGFQIKNRLEQYDSQNETISQVLDLELVNQQDFELHAISFRLPDSERKERNVSFRSIQLVRTIKGTKQLYQAYRKPYFYIVNNLQTNDCAYGDQLDIGHFKISFNKK